MAAPTNRRLVLLLVALVLCLASASDSYYKVRSIVAPHRQVDNNNRNKKSPAAVVPAGGAVKKQTNTQGASIPNEIFNLVKAIVGVGVLSLPAGIAAFGDNPSAVIPALSLIAIIGVLSGFGFAIIGRVCAYTESTSYREAWTNSVGASTSWIPAWSTTLKTLFACLAFSMVLGDSISGLIGQTRNASLLGVTLLVLLPLCLLKDLKSLAPFSLVGVCGMAYTGLAMTVRYLDKSYKMPDGSLIKDVSDAALLPKFGDLGASAALGSKALILVCMLSTAYMAHFNAPKFYLELQNNTIPRFNTVVSWSFGLSILLMGFITAVGFLTFGASCSGLVLNNYASTDLWMSGSRIAVAVSLIFSYPLAFTGCRDGFLDLLQIVPEKRTPGMLNLLTLVLLSTITLGACGLKDVSLVLALAGATLGNALTYVYPAIMYRSIVKSQGRVGENLQVSVSMVSAVLGIVMGAIGAKMALANAR